MTEVHGATGATRNRRHYVSQRRDMRVWVRTAGLEGQMVGAEGMA